MPRGRVSQASGFNDDPVKIQQTLALFGGQQLQGLTQVFADRATDAAVAHLDDVFLRVGHEDVVIDVFFTELVFNDSNFLAVRLGQHALEERGFARAQKTGEDGGGDEGHAGFSCHNGGNDI